MIAAHPDWDEYAWCRYWELDVRKGFRKVGILDLGGRVMDCGERCQCKLLLK